MTARTLYPPILFSTEDAAEYIGIKSTKFNEMQAKGRVIPKDFDGKRMYLRDDLDAFARSLPDWEKRGTTA
ncbi:MAG: helix-turn-helix domain-containing protein [Micrococcales bacterium]|nr:helix-turn-helix domain-containing protein [Micrococcales bacterium]